VARHRATARELDAINSSCEFGTCGTEKFCGRQKSIAVSAQYMGINPTLELASNAYVRLQEIASGLRIREDAWRRIRKTVLVNLLGTLSEIFAIYAIACICQGVKAFRLIERTRSANPEVKHT
jgi:hypothetical protein